MNPLASSKLWSFVVHPVQSVIESLYAAGRCPRLHVNALFEGVSCPDFIREQWRERLIIDLDPSYPLDLTFESDGLGADLSFGGYVTRCSFPYGAVYVVADRSTGRGIVLDQNMPDSVKRTRYGRAGGEARSSGTAKPALRPVAAEPVPDPAGIDGGSEGASDVDPDETKPDVPVEQDGADTAASEAATADSGADQAAAKADEPKADTEQVQKRRAAFRVIDGGS
jgi:stringent starvation protein B